MASALDQSSQTIATTQQPAIFRSTPPHQESQDLSALRLNIETDQKLDIPNIRADTSISDASIPPTPSPYITPRRNSDSSERSNGSSTFPLLQSNPNKNEKTQTLFKQLEDAEEYITKPYFARIIPRGRLEAILTFEAVADDMALNYPGLEKESIDKYAKKVVEEAKKLYAILVLIHQGSIIRQVLDEKIFDTDLPLIYNKPKKMPKQEPSFLGTNKGPVKSFESWPDKLKASFAEVQWRMLAKVFCLGGDYELDENDLLPFMPLEEGEDVRKQGAYGKVYPVRIFPSHHEFKLNDPQALVAVKELLSPDETEFKKEVDVLRMLGSRTSHPNLIKLLATFKQGTQYHLIFPWAHGNLRKYWQDYPNPEFEIQTVIWCMEQMAGLTGALKRVHNCRSSFPRDVNGAGTSGVRILDNTKLSVVKGEEKFGRHGDIKPENILYFAESSQNCYTTHILKLADFGLGRFHGRDSRSGLSPSGIRSSPTYEPPECHLRKSVSRSYDIWSLGCVFLEFATWLMKGVTEVDEFAEFRGTTNVYGIDDDNFFTLLYSKDQTLDAKVRPEVKNWALQLHQHEKCSELIHDLLDTIMMRLLLIEAKDRISITELDEIMQGYLDKAKNDPIYLLKAVPYPSTYPPENINNPSSLANSQQHTDEAAEPRKEIQAPEIVLNGNPVVDFRVPTRQSDDQ
ncbi:hypothetical protein ACMFMG_007247 [Clarireedia jacksonii]